jgi:hypothetical protein
MIQQNKLLLFAIITVVYHRYFLQYNVTHQLAF